MKRIKIIFVSVCMLLVCLMTSVVSFAAEAMTVDVAKQYFAELSGLDAETIDDGYTFFTDDYGSVIAMMNADSSQFVEFYYDENGAIQYSGFFGNSEDYGSGASVLDRGLSQTSGFLTVCGDVANFIVTNELCLIFLGFLFVSRGVGVLRKCLRVTPR